MHPRVTLFMNHNIKTEKHKRVQQLDLSYKHTFTHAYNLLQTERSLHLSQSLCRRLCPRHNLVQLPISATPGKSHTNSVWVKPKIQRPYDALGLAYTWNLRVFFQRRSKV